VVEWQKRLGEAIVCITADDATLAALAVGWPDWEAMRRAFEPRRLDLQRRFIGPHDQAVARVDRLAADLDRERARFRDLQRELWLDYKHVYESYRDGAHR